MGLRRAVLQVVGRQRLALLVAIFALSLGAVTGWAGSSSSGGFVESLPRDRAEVWAVGDGADGGLASLRVARMIKQAEPDRFLYLGDVYETGTAAEYERNYAPAFGRFDAIAAPTLGNHEDETVDEGYDPYWRRVAGRQPPDFYSFRVAGWQILSLNSQVEHDENSPQLEWLRSKTKGGGDCRIAFFHRPRFSASSEQRAATDLQPLWAALRGRARLVVNGHEHNMQRFASRGGRIQLIAGSGGAPLSGVDRGHRRLRFANGKRFGALRMRLRPGRVRHAFVAADGTVLDRGAARC